MKKTFWALLILWMLALLGVSSFSAYDVTNVGDLNFDIAVMLTPYGLIKTYFLQQNELLRPYYLQEAGEGSLTNSASTLFVIFCLQGASALALYHCRKLHA